MGKAALALSAIDRSDQAPINANPNTQERNTMSPTVGNFVHDLVEMAKAMETLPQVQRQVDELQEHNNKIFEHNQQLELNIIGYKEEIERLNAKVRATEAERDDAELRFLELDEKAHKVLAHVASIQAAALVVQESLTPPRPQPEPEAHPQPPVSEAVHSIEPQPQGQGEALPIHGNEPSQSAAGTDTTMTAQTGEGSSPAPQPPASQDQRDVNPPAQPSASTSDTPNDAGQAPATTTGVGSTGGEGSGGKPQPYAGKLYSTHSGYVSYPDWLAGGGTDYSYFH
jgi:hypothetical protein